MQQNGEIIEAGAGNQTVKLFAGLNRSRSVREKNGAFALEGSRLVLDALQTGVKLRAVLLTEKAKEQHYKMVITAKLPATEAVIGKAICHR